MSAVSVSLFFLLRFFGAVSIGEWLSPHFFLTVLKNSLRVVDLFTQAHNVFIWFVLLAKKRIARLLLKLFTHSEST